MKAHFLYGAANEIRNQKKKKTYSSISKCYKAYLLCLLIFSRSPFKRLLLSCSHWATTPRAYIFIFDWVIISWKRSTKWHPLYRRVLIRFIFRWVATSTHNKSSKIFNQSKSFVFGIHFDGVNIIFLHYRKMVCKRKYKKTKNIYEI